MKNNYHIGFVFGAKKASSFDQTFKAINQNIKGIAKGIASLTMAYVGVDALKNVATKAIEGASSLEGYRNTLNVVMKDEKKAAETMKWAVDFANKTPFETDSIVQATVRLESYGIKAQEAMGSIGDMSGVMGKDIMQAVEAVADAQTGELERMKEFGITKNMIAEKADELFKNQQIINNKGQITDQEKFNQAMFALMNDKFKGGMEIQASSFKGLMSTLQGTWSTGLAIMAGTSAEGEIIEGGAFDAAKETLKSFIGKVTEFSEGGGFEKASVAIGKGVTFIINNVKSFASVAMPIISNFKEHAVKAFEWISQTVKDTFGKIKAVINENKGSFETIGTAIQGGIDSAKPALAWLKDTGMPMITDGIASVVDGLIKAFAFIAENKENIIGVIAGIAGAIATAKIGGTILKVASTFGKVINTVKSGATVLSAVTGAVKPIGTAVKAAGAAFSFITSPLGLAALAIGAVITAGVLLYKNWDEIKAKCGPLFAGIKAQVIAIRDKLNDVAAGVQTFFVETFGKIGAFFASFPARCGEVIEKVKALFAAFPEWISGTVIKAGAAFSAIGEHISEIWATACANISGKAGEILESLKTAFSGVGEWFATIFDGVAETFKGFINFFLKGINWIIGGLNKISFTVPNWVPGESAGKTIGIAIPEIPLLAKGGIATAPTLAMIGEGKEHEAVLPLSKLQGMLSAPKPLQMPDFSPLAIAISNFINGNKKSALSTAPINYYYSPNNIFYGNTNKSDVEDVTKTDFERHKKYQQQLEYERRRKGLDK